MLLKVSTATGQCESTRCFVIELRGRLSSYFINQLLLFWFTYIHASPCCAFVVDVWGGRAHVIEEISIFLSSDLVQDSYGVSKHAYVKGLSTIIGYKIGRMQSWLKMVEASHKEKNHWKRYSKMRWISSPISMNIGKMSETASLTEKVVCDSLIKTIYYPRVQVSEPEMKRTKWDQ